MPFLKTCLAASLALLHSSCMAQSNETMADRWLAKADVAPAFKAPQSQKEWEQQREELRTRAWELLGKLPPRPKLPLVESVSRESRDGYTIEKFQFDNGAGSKVPGYVL